MKTMNKTLRAILTLTLLAGALPSRAAYEDVGVGARVTGLGHAYTAVADDAYSVYYNPAGLGVLDRPELSTTYSRLLTGLSDGTNLQNSFLAYARPIDGGRKGAFGAAWNYFTASSLYRETQFMGSYGRGLYAQDHPDRFYLGGTAKILSRTLGGVSEAGNAINDTGVATGEADPDLGRSSKTNLDFDLGFLWRVKPRWTAALAVQHLLEPNVAFSGTDKLGRNIKLGGAYKTPFSTLSGDVRFVAAPDGSMDRILALAVEKWLPTLLHGSFGVRGALSAGSRDHRQLAMGLSYKISRMQLDYGFALPMGGLTSTSGSHRLGLTMRFGRPRMAEAAFGEAVLENLRDLAEVGSLDFRYQMEDLALYKRAAIDEFLRQAKLDAGAGRFADAAEKLTQAASLKPNDSRLNQSLERMKTVAEEYPELAGYQTDAGQAAVYEGALDFVAGDAKSSLRKLAYALTLKPEDAKIEALARAVEAKTGERRPEAAEAEKSAATLGAEKLVGGTMALMEVALRERDYERVIALAEQVLQVDPENATAYKRMGAAQYALKRNAEAMKSLRTAYRLSRDPEERRQLKAYADALAAVVSKGKPAAATAAKPAEAAPAAAPRTGLTPLEIERLYEAGVDLYSQGRFGEAAEAFKKILAAEPDNASARRAYDRVQSEILRGGAR